MIEEKEMQMKKLNPGYRVTSQKMTGKGYYDKDIDTVQSPLGTATGTIEIVHL